MRASSVPRRGAAVDAALYAVSSLFAVGTALAAGIPQFREWGRISIAPYAGGAAVAMLLVHRRAGVRARAWLAAAVLAGVALLPMALETVWRSHTGPGLHAQSEVIVTEEAARALVDGRNPYVVTYESGPLASRPLPTKTHFPYLPGMIAFGLPRALGGAGPSFDARVAFSAVTLAVLGLALARWRAPPDARLLVAQVLVVLPTGTLSMATGGDDLPVLALMLLGLVLLLEGRPGSAGLAAGAAAALKQTAWPLLPFLVLAAGRSWRRAAGAAAAAALPVTAGFLVWDPAAFVEDVVRFPLGLGRGQSAAGTPTPGSLLVELMPRARGPLTATFAVVVAAIGLWLLFGRPRPTASQAAGRAGLVLLAAFLLAPAARLGYIVYPVALLVFASGPHWGAASAVGDATLHRPAKGGGPPSHRDAGGARSVP